MFEGTSRASMGTFLDRHNSVANLAETLRSELALAHIQEGSALSDRSDIRSVVVRAFEALGTLPIDREHRSDLAPIEDTPPYTSTHAWLRAEVQDVQTRVKGWLDARPTLDDRMYQVADIFRSVYTDAAHEASVIGASSEAHANMFLAAIAEHGAQFKDHFSLLTFDQLDFSGETVQQHHAVLFDNLERFGPIRSADGRQHEARPLPDFFGYVQRRKGDLAIIDPGGAIKFESFRACTHIGEAQDKISALLDTTPLRRDLPIIVSFLKQV